MFWAVAVSFEVLLLAFSNALVSRFGPGVIFISGIAAGILRWTLTAFAEALPFIMTLQVLHAASFAMTHLGTMHMIRLMVPERVRNRAQALHSALSGGVLMSGAIWVSGPLYGQYGGKTYLAMAMISLVSLALALMLVRISPKVRAAAAA